MDKPTTKTTMPMTAVVCGCWLAALVGATPAWAQDRTSVGVVAGEDTVGVSLRYAVTPDWAIRLEGLQSSSEVRHGSFVLDASRPSASLSLDLAPGRTPVFVSAGLMIQESAWAFESVTSPGGPADVVQGRGVVEFAPVGLRFGAGWRSPIRANSGWSYSVAVFGDVWAAPTVRFSAFSAGPFPTPDAAAATQSRVAVGLRRAAEDDANAVRVMFELGRTF